MLRSRLSLPIAAFACACTSITEFGDADTSSSGAAESSSTGSTTLLETTDPTATTAAPGTGSTSNDDGSTSQGGASGLFLPDDTESPVAIECNVFEQDCPDGEKCMPWANDGGPAWNATRCVPIAPDAAGLYEPCTVEDWSASGMDTCERGMICWELDDDLMGVCYGMCGGSENAPTCEDTSAYCSVAGDGVLPLCIPYCDPLDVETCDPGEACYPSDSGFLCAPDASGPKLGGLFDPCEFVNACDPGFFCGNADAVGGCEAQGCCTPYCDLSEPEPGCPDPTVCVSLFGEGPVLPGYEDVGACWLEP